MRQRKLVIMFLGAMLMASTVLSVPADAGVNVNIGINLPAHRFAAPPTLAVIPGTYAYFVPDVDVDILFYHNYWYRPFDGRWYRARGYNGPWALIAPGRVPGVIINLPPDYRHVPPGHRRIPYGEFNRNWKTWERDRYWDRHERHEERREEHREDRRDDHREHGDRDRR